jgi:hypothetical protein
LLFSQDGVPATVVVTTPFERLAKSSAVANGVPGFEIMVIDHPVWTRDQVWMDAEADRLAERVIATLFATSKGLAQNS